MCNTHDYHKLSHMNPYINTTRHTTFFGHDVFSLTYANNITLSRSSAQMRVRARLAHIIKDIRCEIRARFIVPCRRKQWNFNARIRVRTMTPTRIYILYIPLDRLCSLSLPYTPRERERGCQLFDRSCHCPFYLFRIHVNR